VWFLVSSSAAVAFLAVWGCFLVWGVFLGPFGGEGAVEDRCLVSLGFNRGAFSGFVDVAWGVSGSLSRMRRMTRW
jgi:hypothetical protein